MTLQREWADGGNGGCDDDQRRRPARPELLDDGKARDREHAHREGRDRHVRKSQHDRRDVVQEGALVEVDAEDLGDLIDDDHDTDAGLEADQHRFRDEVGDKAETQG